MNEMNMGLSAEQIAEKQALMEQELAELTPVMAEMNKILDTPNGMIDEQDKLPGLQAQIAEIKKKYPDDINLMVETLMAQRKI
jgi:hypothetical protein